MVFGSPTGFGASLDPASLDGANGFRLAGLSTHDASVAGAGDVNGDGLADLIVGARVASPGGDFRAGSSYVVFGSSAGFEASLDVAGLDGSNGFRLDGIDEFDDSGSSVAGAGDINGDGIDDLIVGAPISRTRRRKLRGIRFCRGIRGEPRSRRARRHQRLPPRRDRRGSTTAAGQSPGRGLQRRWDRRSDHRGPCTIWTRSGKSYVVFGSAAGFAASLDLAALDGNNGFTIAGTG